MLVTVPKTTNRKLHVSTERSWEDRSKLVSKIGETEARNQFVRKLARNYPAGLVLDDAKDRLILRERLAGNG